MMIVKTIVTGFNADDLFNSWDSDDVARYDERASAERYQELCAEALHEVHPNAEVTIIVNHDSSGALPRGLRTQVNGIDASEANNDEIFDVEYVDEVCSQVYFGY